MAGKLNNLKSVLASGKKNDEKEDEKGKKVLSKSKAAKESRKGEDMGHPGKGFEKVEEKAEKEYGSKKAGEKVAGSVFQKMRKKGDL